MQTDSTEYDLAPADRAPEAPTQVRWLLWAACLCAALWAGAVGAVAYAHFGAPGLITLPAATSIGMAALAFGPGALLVFAGIAAGEAARARAQSEHLIAVAAASLSALSPKAAARVAQISHNLKSDIATLEAIVRAASERLSRFQAALHEDGGVLARALKQDIDAMRTVRTDLRAEAEALGVTMNRNVKILRDTTQYMKSESAAVERAFAEQFAAFGAEFARIGARSAEFAAAAETSTVSADKFDSAVTKALEALAHATSLTDSARQSAKDAAEAASEAARAVRETTGRAVAESREAARAIRAETIERFPNAGQSLFTGRHAAENLAPRRSGVVAELFRAKPARRVPAPANDHGREPEETTLADIVRLCGVRASHVLSPGDLERIARAGGAGAEARRDAVWNIAPTPLRKLSTHLRRDAAARRSAERLRREPGRALGDGDALDAETLRDLTSAYLLVDAALG